MINIKFQIGDKVKVRNDLTVNEEYGVGINGLPFNEEMKSHLGKVGMIVEYDEIDDTFKLDIEDYYWFNEDMVEPINKIDKM